MNVDVERDPTLAGKHTEVIRQDISEVSSPLPDRVKARWGPYKQRQLARPTVTLDQIQAKLAAADEKRQETLRWVMHRAQTHRTPIENSDKTEQRAKRLQAKLAAAELKRQANLAAKSAAAQTGTVPETFLQRKAVARVWLRRQASSRKLQRMWRAFADRRQTTRQLAVSFIKSGITSLPVAHSPKAAAANNPSRAVFEPKGPVPTSSSDPNTSRASQPAIAWVGVNTHVTHGADLPPQEQTQDAFEKFAKAIQSPATLKSAKAILKRLEAKMSVKEGAADVSPLMARLFPKTAKAGGQLERYPARVFLCAYMVQHHPQVVFNTQGELEGMLAAAGKTMLGAFEALLEQLAEPMQVTARADSGHSSNSSIGGTQGTGHLLEAFDRGWYTYLQRFVAWKFADAAALESELIKVAIEMEASVLSKTGGDTSPDTERSEDLQAVIQQVRHDHALLKERVGRLGGPKATARLEAGLAAARAAVSSTVTPSSSTQNSPHSSPARPHSSPGTPPRAVSSPEAVPSSPEGSLGGAAAQAVDPNEAMAWELLYNLSWQLPTEELEGAWKDATGQTAVMKEAQAAPEENVAPAEVAGHVQRRVKRIAEQAFWDAVQASLAQTGADDNQQKVTGQLAGLLAHLGQELMAVLPEQAGAAREQLAAELAEDRLQEALTAHQGSGVNGIDTNHLLSVLEHTAQLLKDMGAPAREAAAVAAQAAIRAELGSALQAGDSPALAAAVVKAVRVLMAQLKMLRLDAANFRLKMLAQTLKGGAGITYAQGKFDAAFGISQSSHLEDLSSRLPHTRAWLALVQGQVPQLSQQLQPAVDFAADQHRVQAAAAAAAPSAVPTQIRSGLRASPSSTSAAGAAPDAAGPGSAARLIHPVTAESWRGTVRLGLVHLVAGEIPVERTALAETLRLDAQKLHSAQNELQQLVVLAACMLLLQQSVAGQQAASRTMPDVADVKRRLVSILADPSMRLPDLAAELTRLAGIETDGLSQAQAAMEAGLNRMLLRSSGAFKALSSGISTALQLQLLAGPISFKADAGLQQAFNSALARCGAGALKAEVAELSMRLGQTAALSEAVHVNIYQTLLSDLL